LNKSDFSSLETVFATDELHKKFSEIASPMLLKIENLVMSNKELISLRVVIIDGLISSTLELPIEMVAL
jgi:hypothetical protein